MIYGYARVSKTDQNLDLQINALKKRGCDKIFTDKKSGVSKNRPALDDLLRFAETGDIVVVYKMDRISRSTKQMLSLASTFKERGIKFVSLQDQIDTTTPIGEFFFTVTSGLAQLERDIIAQRTRDGLAAAKERGVKLGKPKGMTLKNKQKCAYAHECITKLKKSEKKSISKILEVNEVSRSAYYRYLRETKANLTEE